MQNSLDRNTDDDVDHRRSSNTKVLSRTTIAHLGKARHTIPRIDHSKDKELINNGLHKLVSTFNSANKITHKSSKVNTGNKSRVVTAENSIPESRQMNSHITLTKQISVDKYTMTDFLEGKEKKVDLESTALGKQPYSGQDRDLQWTDPRLLKKYALVNQPCKKALTIPHVSKSDYEESQMDDQSDEISEIICSDEKQIFFRCIHYICTTSVSFVGAMCGIVLITLLLWKVLDENTFSFLFETPNQDLFFKRNLTNLAKMLICVMSNLFGKISRFLTMSASEVFAKDEGSVWYRHFVK